MLRRTGHGGGNPTTGDAIGLLSVYSMTQVYQSTGPGVASASR